MMNSVDVNLDSKVHAVKKHNRKQSMKNKKIVSSIIAYAVLIILSIIWLYPVVWIILSAFRGQYNDAGNFVGIPQSNYFPTGFSFESFRRLFTPGYKGSVYFSRWFMNTLIVAIFTCILSTLIQLCVAYVMSKLKFRLRKAYLNLAMILGLFPGFMSMIAIYFILKAMGLNQSLFALILCYSAGSGLGFYVAKGFFDVIPDALIESARIDGATNARIFRSIVLPMSKPIMIYTALMTFMGPWMDFIFANVILGRSSDPGNVTVAVGLYNMMYGKYADLSMFTVFSAGCVVVAVPIVLLFVSLQKYYVEGVTAGAVK